MVRKCHGIHFLYHFSVKYQNISRFRLPDRSEWHIRLWARRWFRDHNLVPFSCPKEDLPLTNRSVSSTSICPFTILSQDPAKTCNVIEYFGDSPRANMRAPIQNRCKSQVVIPKNSVQNFFLLEKISLGGCARYPILKTAD